MKPRLPYETLDTAFELKSLNDAGELEGYAAVFGNVDRGGDVIEAGAFTKTLAETNGQVPVLYQHDRYEPIGVSTKLEQDRYGLKVEGQLNMEVQRARETRALLNQGAMQGLSIGYRAIKAPRENGARHLKEVGLIEFSPVTFPMNPLAVATVKADGDVVWDTTATMDALRRAVSGALNPDGRFLYYVRDIAADGASALVENYDDEVEAWVVPFTVDDAGDVDVAPASDWVPAKRVWVEDDASKADDFALLQLRALTNEIRGAELDERERAAIKHMHDQFSALLERQPAPATADDDGAALKTEEPAIATFRALINDVNKEARGDA